MGSLLGYGRQYRWRFRLDSDDFRLAVLRQSRRQQVAIHSGAFSGQHFDSVQASRQRNRGLRQALISSVTGGYHRIGRALIAHTPGATIRDHAGSTTDLREDTREEYCSLRILRERR
jgi:hypothetical protein